MIYILYSENLCTDRFDEPNQYVSHIFKSNLVYSDFIILRDRYLSENTNPTEAGFAKWLTEHKTEVLDFCEIRIARCPLYRSMSWKAAYTPVMPTLFLSAKNESYVAKAGRVVSREEDDIPF
jgi:hypothetical protein